MASSTIPGSLRTLAHATPGQRVIVDCLLRATTMPRCVRCALGRECAVLVRDVGPNGVLVTLADGTDLCVRRECAAAIQVEPADDEPPRRRRQQLG